MRKSLETSQEEKQAFLKKAGRDRFLNFCEIIDPKYDVNWHHQIIAEKLQKNYEKLLQGIPSRLIIECPVRSGKSELATIKFPAWVLGKSPELPIIVVSYSADKAEDFGLATRDIMSQNDNYKLLFDTKLRADTQAKKKWLTEANGGYTAAGAGTGITGKGFKLGILDDLIKNKEEAESELIRDKVWDWYRSTFYTRQDGISMIVVILSRWHLDDLVGRLEEQENQAIKAGIKNYDEWEYITFKAIATEDEEFRKKGEALWPSHRPLSELKKAENTLGPFDFAALYQQQPLPSGKQEFKKFWFKYYDPIHLTGRNLEHYTVLDLGGEQEDNDETAILTVGKERGTPYWYRIEETAGIMNPDEALDALFYHRKTYKSSVWLELNDIRRLGYWVKEKQKKDNNYFTINELKHNQKIAKKTRIRGLVPLYASGAIYHRRDDEVYEKQLLEFPVGKLDDRIDVMASMLEAINTPTQYTDQPEIPQKEIKTDPYF